MNRIFVRFFVLVMLAITVATFAIYFAISHLFGDPFEEIALKQASAQIFLLEQYIDKAPADEWLLRLNKVREVSKVNFELIPLTTVRSSLPTEKIAVLMRGDVVLDVASKSFFRRVDLAGGKYVGSEDDVIHAENLPIDVGLAVKMELVRYVIVAFCLLIPIAIWSSLHWRGLQSLSKVANDFGEGKLSARAAIRKTASIYPLAERMNQMAAHIENLLDTQKNLMHSVSHELRTPIARLEFGLELLRKDVTGGIRHDAVEGRIQGMEADLTELNTLVSELLSLTKLDQQLTVGHTQFVVADTLRNCIETLGYTLAGKQVTANFSEDAGSLVGDQRLISRAVSNLVANAAKYANHHIALSARRLKDGSVEISVEDDGPGIPIDERERIFAPFYRLDRSRDRMTGGFGLGLAIAQKAVSLHGGQIHATASSLGGAKFVLNIPIYQ
ncbi:ATP-binding protein [Undibacterium sp.]|jgi:two-component system OmpR family sensor kinase|uniref:ATP-binding protein n=1 Tax=Undibacterium sp. TaxID=1914977 RepID=UPI002CCCA496|nr:ATP-binding protein [Undibacterium sp.]HTD02219.1 ATP-binding protein [Undibacterium sp.]